MANDSEKKIKNSSRAKQKRVKARRVAKNGLQKGNAQKCLISKYDTKSLEKKDTYTLTTSFNQKKNKHGKLA